MSIAFFLLVAAVVLVFGIPAGLVVVLSAATFLTETFTQRSLTMWELDLTSIFAAAVLSTFILFGLIGCARALTDHWQEYRALREECERRRTQERNRERQKMKRRTIGYLISDHAMGQAKQVAALLGVNPLTQNDEFSRLCDICKEALAGYDHRARQLNRKLDPLEEAFPLSFPEEG